VSKRLSRREVKAEVEWQEAERQARRAASEMINWYNATEAANYELCGVVRDDEGQLHRGYKLGTLRTLLDTDGILTQLNQNSKDWDT
jgi:hypothetical protein